MLWAQPRSGKGPCGCASGPGCESVASSNRSMLEGLAVVTGPVWLRAGHVLQCTTTVASLHMPAQDGDGASPCPPAQALLSSCACSQRPSILHQPCTGCVCICAAGGCTPKSQCTECKLGGRLWAQLLSTLRCAAPGTVDAVLLNGTAWLRCNHCIRGVPGRSAQLHGLQQLSTLLCRLELATWMPN